jgi:hypothetical protein
LPALLHSDRTLIVEPTSPPGDAEVRAALERITASRQLRAAPRLIAFLRYVVERTLAGRSDEIKSYTIAVEALGREPSFDPQTDPIVRVEAGRLRHAMARYYARDGRDDPLVIAVPRGSYVPIFRRSGAPPARAAVPVPSTTRPASELAGLIRRLLHVQAEYRALADTQRRVLGAIRAEIVAVRQTLAQSRALLQSRQAPEFACRTAPWLLPTAPSAPAEPAEPKPDGRQVGKTEQAESAPAARACRPRAA